MYEERKRKGKGREARGGKGRKEKRRKGRSDMKEAEEFEGSNEIRKDQT